MCDGTSGPNNHLYIDCNHAITNNPDKSSELYVLFRAKISDYLKIVKAEIAKWKDNSKEFLREYTKQWKKYTMYARSLVNVFRYLDQYYLRGQGGRSVTNAALEIFRNQIFMPNL